MLFGKVQNGFRLSDLSASLNNKRFSVFIRFLLLKKEVNLSFQIHSNHPLTKVFSLVMHKSCAIINSVFTFHERIIQHFTHF